MKYFKIVGELKLHSNRSKTCMNTFLELITLTPTNSRKGHNTMHSKTNLDCWKGLARCTKQSKDEVFLLNSILTSKCMHTKCLFVTVSIIILSYSDLYSLLKFYDLPQGHSCAKTEI